MPDKYISFFTKRKTLLTLAANAVLFLTLIFIIYGKAILNINHYYIGTEGDSSYYIWIAKWFSQFLSHPNTLHVTNVYYPIGIDISAGWEGSILFYVGGFFNSFFSEAASYNLVILFPLLLDWAASYFVFNKFSKRLFISGLFATLFCTSTFFIARSLGHPTYLYFFHIPLLFYFLQHDWLKGINLKKALLLIVVYVLISITSWYYFIFAIIITAIYLISFAIKNGKSDFKIYKKIALTYAGVLIAVIVFNFPMFKAFFWGSSYFFPYPFRMNNAGINQQLSMHAIDYLKPFFLNTIYYKLSSWVNGYAENNLFPGISYFFLLPISLFYILKHGKYKNYFIFGILAVLFFILSLGYNSPLPLYRWLNSLPIASTLHAPPRFGIIVIFVGWLIIASAIKHAKGKAITAVLLILIFIQFFESANFRPVFENFDNLSILKSIEPNKQSPVLELPMRSQASEALLTPALSGRAVFSGYPQHTTYSPQLDYYDLNNVLDSLDKQEKTGPDVAAELTAAESAAYLKWKFGVEDVVCNKQLTLSPKASEILKYFSLIKENDNYAIYRFEQIPNLENDPDVKIVTGKGIGQLINGVRTIAEKAELDILNFSDQPQKLKFHFVAAGITPKTNYAIDGNTLKKDVVISAEPGLGTITITSDKKCIISGADCITGTISEINVQGIK
ncbi:MAG: hypothetical protein Q8L09_00810 [Candidatus Moranbacteria bacterium]|nr:hypothetical protein [Candidatus Moranbacteria bacterium]